ncbi:cadherin repeat domain-containing protein, partial [Rubellimicrobium rubrum]|uniref:cadherin repeat domain-containing protein n=1 Tax=Rubellimicrobium rubrum TaxID=2585369 RepID=UPI00159BEFC3
EGTPPVVTGPDGTAQEQSQRIPEGRTLVATFHSDEPVTWSLASRGDAGAFRIDPVTGELRFRRAPEFDTPADMDGDNVYLLTVIAMDAEGNMTEIVFAVTVEDTVAPQISGPSGLPGAGRSATSVDEGTTTVATFTANEMVTWSIAGGVDAAHFGMDPTTGELRFVIAPDFENPKDQDADNSYVVVVTATDANGNVSQQIVTVGVANVTDTPSELFEERRDEVEAIVRDVEENHLRAAVAAQQDTTRSARNRFIEGQRLRELCSDIDDPSQPVTSALRNNDECSLLATRNDVAFDADGTLEVGEGGINGAGTFFGQHGSFDGTRRRIVEGTFQLVDDGEG